MGDDVLLHFTKIHSFEGNTFWQYILLGIFTGLFYLFYTHDVIVEGKFKNKSWFVRLLVGGLIMGALVFLSVSWGEGYREIGMILKAMD